MTSMDPVIYQPELETGAGSEFGLGAIQYQAYLSPGRFEVLSQRTSPGGHPLSSYESAFSNARSRRSGVTGISSIHTPTASWIALTMAGAGTLAVISPIPFAP